MTTDMGDCYENRRQPPPFRHSGGGRNPVPGTLPTVTTHPNFHLLIWPPQGHGHSYENRPRQTRRRGKCPCGCPSPAPTRSHPLMWPSQGHGVSERSAPTPLSFRTQRSEVRNLKSLYSRTRLRTKIPFAHRSHNVPPPFRTISPLHTTLPPPFFPPSAPSALSAVNRRTSPST